MVTITDILTFNHTDCTEDRFNPPGTHEPLLDVGNDRPQVLRIRFHDPIELDELARPEEHLGNAEFEIIVVQLERVQHRLAEGTRIELGQLRRQIRLVHVVQLVERHPRWVAVLHQLQHRRGAGTLELRQRQTSLELVVHHAAVRLDTADEICALEIDMIFLVDDRS